jgi:hypothetical protein
MTTTVDPFELVQARRKDVLRRVADLLLQIDAGEHVDPDTLDAALAAANILPNDARNVLSEYGRYAALSDQVNAKDSYSEAVAKARNDIAELANWRQAEIDKLNNEHRLKLSPLQAAYDAAVAALNQSIAAENELRQVKERDSSQSGKPVDEATKVYRLMVDGT